MTWSKTDRLDKAVCAKSVTEGLGQALTGHFDAFALEDQGPLAITLHRRTELVNAICRVSFPGHLDADALAEALGDLAADS